MLLTKKQITLGFRELRLLCQIGVHPHEREAPQEILVTLEVDIEVTSLHTDSLEETVDYDQLRECIEEVAGRGYYHLLETFAEKLLAELSEKFPILRAKITVEKPAAMATARCAFVTMEWKET